MVEQNSQRWLQVKAVLNRALELAPLERNSFIADACGDEHSLRLEVEALLGHVEDAEKDEFLEDCRDTPANVHTGDTPQSLAGRALRVRCPHCHYRIDVSIDAPLTNLVCRYCKQQFSLACDSDDPTESQMVARIGDFELVERLGIGGFATVWKARDSRLDRTVAIKIPRKGQLDALETAQFLREARAAAQLRHPNIVTVHEVGKHGRCVYIVSDFIDGAPLSGWTAGQKLTSREAAKLCLKIAAALDHAHQAGIIHRDLKPHNIMIDAGGEPHLTDFGLARRRAGEVTMTIQGQVMGTPAYMSPEQARGDAHVADQCSDLYSLGVILFELLTGEVPFRGNVEMLLHQVLHEDPPNPRKLNGNVAHDLDTICMKCLEKAPENRYRSAAELQGELHRYLSGMPIVSRPVGRVSKAWRWCKRKPAVAALLATSLLLLLSLAIGATVAAWRFNEKNEQVTANFNRAVAAETDRQRRLYEAYLAQAQAERTRRTAGRRFNALKAIGQAANVLRQMKSNPTEREQRISELRNEAIAAFALRDLRVDRQYKSDVPRFSALHRWDFDAEVERFAVPDADGNLAVLSVSDAQPGVILPGRWRWDNADSVPVTCFSPTGDHVAIRGRWRDGNDDQQRVQLWKLSTRERILDLPVRVTEHVNELAFTANGRRLACLTDDLAVRICDVEDGKKLATVDLESCPYSIEFCPKTDRLVLSFDTEIHVVNWRANHVEERLQVTDPIAHAIVSPSGELLAAASEDGNVYLWERSESWQLKREFNGHRAPVQRLAFHPLSRLLASWSWDGTTRLWDVDTGSELVRSEGHAVCFSQDGRWLGFASPEAEFGRWEVAAADECRVLNGSTPRTAPTLVSFGPEGRFLSSVSRSEGAIVWDVANFRESARIDDGTATRLCFFHPTERILITSEEERVHIWNLYESTSAGELANVELFHVQSLSSSPIPSPAISGDGRTFVYKKESDATSCTVVVVPWADRDSPTEFVHDDSGWFHTLSPDGKLGATGTRDCAYVYVWDVETGSVITKISTKVEQAATTDFSPNGKQLCASFLDECVFYSTDTWRILHRIENDLSGFGSVAFSPDMQLLAVTQKYYVSLRDPDSYRELARLASRDNQSLTRPILGPEGHLAFSPDGRLLAVGTTENSVQLWDLQLVRSRLAEMGLDW